MLRSIGLPELLVILVVVLCSVPGIFYIITLQKTLERCSPAARTMSPGKAWLLLIPLFNIVWHFIVVVNIAKSLHAEFVRRGLSNADAEPGKALGLAMCCLAVASWIPVLAGFCALAGFICWIIYWVKISGYSRELEEPSLA
jgi:hypothetical protein